MSQTKPKQSKTPKKATQPANPVTKPVVPKTSQKKPDFSYDPNLHEDSEEDYDHIIESIQTEVAPIRSNKLKISDYVDDEAEEQPKAKKTKTLPTTSKVPNKSWSAGEAALMKVLIVGTPPLGRNSSGINSLLS